MGIRTVVVLSMVVALGCGATADAQPRPIGKGPVGFWIAVDSNTVFDEQALRAIAERAGLVALNAELEAAHPSYQYAAIVKRLHELQPGLPVLISSWASSWRQGGRMATDALPGFGNQPQFLITDARGETGHGRNGKVVFGDLRNDKLRDWMVNNLEATTKRTGADGVILDLALRTPLARPKPLADRCKRDAAFCDAYARGMDGLFGSLKSRLGSRVVLYNGLWAGEKKREANLLQDQKRLLAVTDGAAVEFFGMDPQDKQPPPFNEGILGYLEAIREQPNKVFLVFGRGPRTYSDYLQDYMWQRYVYAAYLLAAGPRTLFKFHTTFQVPTKWGRANGMDVYEDWDLDLGEPRGAFQNERGLYVRRFAKGLVLVAPHDGAERTYTVTPPMFTPEGERIDGSVRVRPGQGLLLLNSAPPPPKPARVDFEDGRHPATTWRWVELRTEGSTRYLHLEKAQGGQDWEHDLVLETTRRVGVRPRLQMRVRTTDPAARILLVAEVDDAQRQQTEVVVEIGASGGAERRTTAIAFRKGVRRGDDGDTTPAIAAPQRLGGEGWQTIEIAGDTVVREAGRYTFRRWKYARFIGTLDLDDVEVREAGRS